MAVSPHPLCPSQPLASSDLCLPLWVLLFCTFHRNRIVQHVVFCDWLLSLGVVFASSSVRCVPRRFLWQSDAPLSVYTMYIFLSTHLSTHICVVSTFWLLCISCRGRSRIRIVAHRLATGCWAVSAWCGHPCLRPHTARRRGLLHTQAVRYSLLLPGYKPVWLVTVLNTAGNGNTVISHCASKHRKGTAKIRYYDLRDHRYPVCSRSLMETSLCGAWLYGFESCFQYFRVYTQEGNC